MRSLLAGLALAVLIGAGARGEDDAADLVVVEGPFEGDVPAALDTTRLWLERARVMLSSPARAVADAHVAAGGLANR